MSGNRFISVALVSVVCVFCGCTEHLLAPRSTIPLRNQMVDDGYGSFLQVTYKSPQGGINRFAGEFIGMRNDSILILNQNTWISVRQENCSEAVLILFKNNAGLMSFVGLGGVAVSTVLNGGYVILSGPIWIVGSIITGITEGSRANSYVFPLDPWDKFIPYARFPQGIPNTVNMNDLEVRPNAEYRISEYNH